MAHLLVVDDEEKMTSILKDNLEFEGYQVSTAKDGREGLQKIREGSYDMILLDVMMPHISGFDVCKQIRADGIATPVIILTAKGEEIDKVLGLELGADDYITKPFSLRELLARIKAILRRTQDLISGTDEHKVGKLTVHFSSYDAFENGTQIAMTHREFDVLKYLWQHKNRTVSRDDLLSSIWQMDDGITARTVDNFILHLRQKVEFNPSHPRHILTVHGIGYKFID
ncbi:MAG: DNA-binding response regulator [Calditrichaeota bacterium]|nr:MAG: DNA-binding response regulator [Calditrichota bacterium]MBL1207618.1 DNA-binding response regulator [Calditrichota bacterium]NOG47451.1 response regulator transcription factor [Calditrichota bacterium]